MSDPKFRICVNVDPQPKTCTLNCAHCRLDHDVEQFIYDKYSLQASNHGIPLTEIWWCGRCYLVYTNTADILKCDCPEHDVPPFPDRQETDA